MATRSVGQGGWRFPRSYTLLEAIEVVVLELEHQFVGVSSEILEESARVASHVAEENAGLPNFQLEVAFLYWTLSKLNMHKLCDHMMAPVPAVTKQNWRVQLASSPQPRSSTAQNTGVALYLTTGASGLGLV
jgi:hypothetical protein